MNRTTLAPLAVAAATIVFASCASEQSKPEPTPEQPPTASAPLSVKDTASVVLHAAVESLDYDTRRITLRDSSGRTTRFIVGPQVQRLNEVKVGDTVRAELIVSLEAELRPPTPEEEANPILIEEISGRAPQETEPAGSVRRRVRVVTTVEAVDLGKMRVTLKGPMGDTTTVRARNPENVKKLHVGDTIVITYVESSVISVLKTSM